MHQMQIIADGMTAEAELEVIRQAGVILAAFISAVGVVLVAIINRARQHSKNAREHAKVAADNSRLIVDEVKNSHTTNLREESDERHGELIEKLERVIAVQAEQGEAIHELRRDVGGLRGDVREVRTNLEHERSRIRDLEDTRPRGSRPGRPHRKDTP